jgi:putative transposase
VPTYFVKATYTYLVRILFNCCISYAFHVCQYMVINLQLSNLGKNFQRFHNKHHRYSCLKGKTPLEVIEESDYNPIKLGANTKLPQIEEIPDGDIVLIRFIRSNRLLDVFGERFKVSKDLVYSYVKGVIVTDICSLQVYLGDELVQQFEYQLTS